MRTWVTGLLVSMLWVSPIMIEVGTAGTTGEQAPEQKQIISKDDFKLIQERLKAEGVYAGPVDGEVNAQTEAALRAYQQKRGIPVSGAADEATIRSCSSASPPAVRGRGRREAAGSAGGEGKLVREDKTKPQPMSWGLS